MTFSWSPETTQRLCVLWATPDSTRTIGQRLGCSKNAVIGKARRLGLPERGSPIIRTGSTKSPKVPRARPLPPGAATIPQMEAPAVLTLVERPRPVARKPAPSCRGCLWPTWAAKTEQYWAAITQARVIECGAPLASPDRPYCASHRATGTTPIARMTSVPRPTTAAHPASR